MKHRVLSLETEYTVVHQPLGEERPNPDRAIELIQRELHRRYGAPGSQFLVNGSRVYSDVKHAEWSLPECRTPREVALYDCAADRALGMAGASVAASLGGPLSVRVFKNNVDPAGHTAGCHENYQALRETPWLSAEGQLRLTIRFLVPFLVTRQIWCGSGRVGWGTVRQDGLGFQMSQRADFIDAVASKDTRSARGIINVGREHEPLAAKATYRRLHLILGDANLSPWANMLKVGATSLLLRQIEDLQFGELPHLADPVAALRTISRDLTCRAQVPLRGGGSLSAVDIQRRYHEGAAAYVRSFGASPDDRHVLDEWGQALDALARDPASLCFKVDWVTKKLMLDRVLARHRSDWEKVKVDGDVATALLANDVECHQIAPVNAYPKLVLERNASYVDSAAIDRAIVEPPPYTRARIRGDLVASARRKRYPLKVEWDKVDVGGRVIALDDPLAFFDPQVFDAVRPAQPGSTS